MAALKLTERQAAAWLGKKAGKAPRQKAQMDPEQFEAAYAFRKASGCWHPLTRDKKTGYWYCQFGPCKEV